MENNELQQPVIEKNEASIFAEEDLSIGIYDKHIRQARNAIFIAAGILLINVLILANSLPSGYEYAWIDLGLWGVFIAGFIFLGFWTKKKPYYARIGALILYGLFIALNAVLDVTTIYKGIIMKIIIISLLIKGLSDAKAAQELQGISR
jgi:peptidoglycan/LPS O-acetylase OafA/YrhL